MVGDIVRVMETRPPSMDKRWRVVEIVERLSNGGARMIQQETYLKVADNTGAKEPKCIRVLGGSKRKYASIGDVIVCSIRKAAPAARSRKGDVVKRQSSFVPSSLFAAQTAPVRFDENAAVLINTGDKNPRGTRIFGPRRPASFVTESI